jgi:hypothetical protein
MVVDMPEKQARRRYLALVRAKRGAAAQRRLSKDVLTAWKKRLKTPSAGDDNTDRGLSPTGR